MLTYQKSMRIRIQQLNVTVGDIPGNTRLITEALECALENHVDLLVLPELVVCGYPPMDLLERRAFLESVARHNEIIVQQTRSAALLFGTIRRNPQSGGRPLFNAAVLAHEGKVVAEVSKTLLPTYDVFDEYRYFEPSRECKPVVWAGRKWGITICEDIWNNENEYNYHTYEVDPAGILKEMGAEILINISASPFTSRKPEMRQEMLCKHARRLQIPVIYSNQVGANTELIFDGSGSAVAAGGETILRLPMFEKGHGDVDWDRQTGLAACVNSQPVFPFFPMEERLFRALVLGLRDYVEKSGMSRKVLLGLSGGIDSALTAVIAAEALGKENVTGITMPSAFSSKESMGDSALLAQNLGIHYLEIPIHRAYDLFLELLQPVFAGTEFGVAEENIQSRSRGILLMAYSNKFGHMLLNTGNKSELAVGYCTLYGDMAGGLSVLSDLYKTEVYAVSRWVNEHFGKTALIPLSTLDKPPSAELRPDQKDTDSLPEYPVLDNILKSYIEEQMPAEQIVGSGFEPGLVRKIIRMVDLNEYKRRQAAPGLRVSFKAFGMGRRLPIVQRWTEQA